MNYTASTVWWRTKTKPSQPCYQKAPGESRCAFQDILATTKPAISNPTAVINTRFKSDYANTGGRGWVSWLKAHDEKERAEREASQNSPQILVDKESYQENQDSYNELLNQMGLSDKTV